MTELLTGGTTLTPDGWSADPLGVQDGIVVDAQSAGEAGNTTSRDVSGLFLTPGFIELQINGGWGIDLQRQPQDLWQLASRLPEVGVTAFLPTLTTNGYRHLDVALRTLLAGPPPGWVGATPLGWHLEGPWLAPSKAGAHGVRALQRPSDASPVGLADGVRLVTLAPELPGAHRLIEDLVDRGVVVSLGHSAATPDEARAASRAGATLGTHLFNAMDGLHHREPGLAAALLLGDFFFSLIADGQHVAPDVVDLAWRLAGDRLILVSDAVALLGVTDEPVARLADGTIAGGVVGLDQCVRNLMAFADVELEAAVVAASTNPAKVLGLTDRGWLGSGAQADVVGLDVDGQVALTMIGGRVVFERSA